MRQYGLEGSGGWVPVILYPNRLQAGFGLETTTADSVLGVVSGVRADAELGTCCLVRRSLPICLSLSEQKWLLIRE